MQKFCATDLARSQYKYVCVECSDYRSIIVTDRVKLNDFIHPWRSLQGDAKALTSTALGPETLRSPTGPSTVLVFVLGNELL